IIWDWRVGTRIKTVQLQPVISREINSVAYSPNDRWLAAGTGEFGSGGEIKILDAGTGQETLSLQRHTSDVRGVTFSPDSRRLASCGGDYRVRIWDTATAREIATLRGHQGTVYAITYSPTGAQIASAGEDRTVYVWDVASGSPLFSFRGLPGTITAASL